MVDFADTQDLSRLDNLNLARRTVIDHKIDSAAFAPPAANDASHLHSHITAFFLESREKTVDYSLKIDQWNWAKKQKYSHISWTLI